MVEKKVILRNIRISPRKLRLVCDQLRGFDLLDALDILRYSNKKSVEPLMKLFNSCMSNLSSLSDEVKGMDAYYVKKIFVDEGSVMKRFRPRARGRAGKIKRKMSKVTLVLSEVKGATFKV